MDTSGDGGDTGFGLFVLGTLLFLIYINELEKNIKSTVKFDTDDTMLFSMLQDLHIYAAVLNDDIKAIS